MQHIKNILQENFKKNYRVALNESASPIVLFPGRFQPFHMGHYQTYQQLVKKFGKDRVYLTTSDRTDNDKSPLNFDEKQALIHKMFDIPKDKIVKVREPYKPRELTSQFPQDTPVVIASSEKDRQRFAGSKYWKSFDDADKNMQGFRDAGYLMLAPDPTIEINGKRISGSQIRELFRSNMPTEQKKKLFSVIYPKFDASTFHFLADRFSDPQSGPKIHISHPYDDMNMTFNGLKDILKNALVGDFGGIATEKTDGQNVLFTVRDGNVLFARNTQHTKNNAENGLRVQDIKPFFAKLPPRVGESYEKAASEISDAIQKLTLADQEKYFGGGKRFISAEIINSDTTNTVPYDQDLIVFHYLQEMDATTGNPIGLKNKKSSDIVAKKITRGKKNPNSKFGLSGNRYVVFSDQDQEKYNDRLEEHMLALREFQERFGLNDSNTLGDAASRILRSYLGVSSLNWTDEEIDGITERIVYGDKTFGTKSLPDDAKKNFLRNIDAKRNTFVETLIKPIKYMVLSAGVDAVERSTNLINTKESESSNRIRTALTDKIKRIRMSNDPEKIEKMERNLDIINSMGMDSVGRSEGTVFFKNGRLYKLTGAFAPTHQILSIRNGDVVPMDNSKSQNSPTQVVSPKPPTQAAVPITRKDRKSLDGKIINPQTKNNILVKTALKYPKDHPAYRVAKKYLGEGGNQFSFINSAVPRSELKTISDKAVKLLGIKTQNAPLGNTEKEYLGDIDIGIDKNSLEKKLGVSFEDKAAFYKKLADVLDQRGIKHKILSGLNIFSIPVETGFNAIDTSGNISNERGVAQVDLFVGNPEWMQKFLSGPNGSKYKASARNIFMQHIVSNVDFSTKNRKVKQKFQFNVNVGLEMVSFTEQNGKRVKFGKKLVTSDPDKMAGLLFGKGSTWDDINTFEKAYDKMKSDSFPYKNRREQIITSFVEDLKKRKGIDVSDEINGKIDVWIDDMRDPPAGWKWFKNGEDAIKFFSDKNNWDRVRSIGFDHDLGDDSKLSGYDVAKWIEEKVIADGWDGNKKYSIQSANPTGRKNIAAAIDSIERNDSQNLLTKQSVDMTQRILNPQTKNKILIKTALKYPKDHPAYQTAIRILNKNRK